MEDPKGTELTQPGEGLPLTQNRKWDWRVIVLELVIVFVGLFGALQLDSYNDQQQFKAQQVRYLQRLAQDLTEYVDSNASMIEFLELNMRAVAHVSSSLQAGQILDGDKELFEHGLIYFAHLPSINLPRATYDEMVASGMFSALQSGELKNSISSLFSFHDQTERNFTWWRDHMERLSEALTHVVEFGYSAESSDLGAFVTDEPDRTVQYNFGELADSREMRNRFYWAADTSKDWHQMTRLIRNRAEQVLGLIDRELADSG